MSLVQTVILYPNRYTWIVTEDLTSIPGMSSGVRLLERLRPYVRHCGNARRGAWSMGERKLLDYLLVYIAEGRGEFVVAGETVEAGPGDLFWIPPDTVHAMRGDAPGMHCPFVHFDLVYRGAISHWDFTIPAGMCDLSAVLPLMHPPLETDMEPLASLCGVLRLHTHARIGRLIDELCIEAARAQPYVQLRLSGMMLEIVAEVLRGYAGLTGEQGVHVPALERAALFLREQCERSVSVEQAAELCALSPSYFRRVFAGHFGCSPRAYLRNARILKAKRLMVASSLNLTEIAERVGFATVHSFSRAFRQAEGIAPSEYRRFSPEVATHVSTRIHSSYSR